MMVAYRSLSRADAKRVRELLLKGENFDIDHFGDITGEGDELNIALIGQIAASAADDVRAGANSETVEQHYSGNLYLALRSVPVDVRDNPGFWRWITLGPFFPFTCLRDPKFGVEAVGAGSNLADILACRMFLRGQVSRVAGADGTLDFSLASSPGIKSHDFWQSHILRRTTGAEIEFAQALIKQQSTTDTKLSTEKLRPFVRDSINRKKRTLATFLMSGDEAAEYLKTERVSWHGNDDDEIDDSIEDDLD